jgi:hypothetical protein
MRLPLCYFLLLFNRRWTKSHIRPTKIIISCLKRYIANRFVGALLDVFCGQSIDNFCFFNRTLIKFFLKFNHKPGVGSIVFNYAREVNSQLCSKLTFVVFSKKHNLNSRLFWSKLSSSHVTIARNGQSFIDVEIIIITLNSNFFFGCYLVLSSSPPNLRRAFEGNCYIDSVNL